MKIADRIDDTPLCPAVDRKLFRSIIDLQTVLALCTAASLPSSRSIPRWPNEAGIVGKVAPCANDRPISHKPVTVRPTARSAPCMP